MLGLIFGSVSRVKMLNLFLLSPEKKYQQKQLIRDLNLPAVSMRHELANLIKFGLIREEVLLENEASDQKNKKIKVYSTNDDFLLYPEIKALFTKAQVLFSQKFISGLQKICQPKFIALTGLFTNYPEAQTDLLVVGSIKRSVFLKLLHELEKDLGREINFTILSVKEFHYRENVMDIFLYNILEGKTLVVLDNIHKSS
ncbi:MAG: hypothetical protein WC249_02160 [Patescibacteria group bacterium]|jgi:hypothetical protein